MAIETIKPSIYSLTSDVSAPASTTATSHDEDLVEEAQERLTELYNELAQLRQIPVPTSSTTLQNQYSELLGAIQDTLQGAEGDQNDGLLSLFQEMQNSSDPDVQIFIQNSKGAFNFVNNMLNHGNIGSGTLAGSSADIPDLAKFLAGTINQNGQNFITTLMKYINELSPQG